MTPREKKELKELIKECLIEVLDQNTDRRIGAKEVAAIFGYKSTSMVLRNPEFFGGWQEGPGCRWQFSERLVNKIASEGRRPVIETRQLTAMIRGKSAGKERIAL